jgi:hypothetical protein
MQRSLQQGRKGANGGGGGVGTEQKKKKYEFKVRCDRARSQTVLYSTVLHTS